MTGGLVLGEALNLWIPAEQMIFGLAVWLLFLVCVFVRRKSRYGLPVFLFVAGMSAGCLRMGAEQAVFSREEGFFREEHEDGVVLQGTVQSVKEKDGTLEVVLRDCAMEGKDGESGEKLRRVLCYLDVNKTGEAAEALSKQKPSPAVGEKSESSEREKRQDRREILGRLITVCIAGPAEFPGSSMRRDIR